MKKTLRTITSAILIAIIALGSTVAAFATGGSIEWVDTDYEASVYYAYGGKELELGTSVINNTNPGDNLVYYEFEAENSGYYTIYTEESWIKVPDYMQNGKAYDFLPWELIDDNGKRLYYIEKGENIIGFNLYDNETDTVEIEYLAEEIVDFTIEEEALDNIIIGWDINKYDAGTFWITSDSVVTFSNGTELSLEDFEFECTNKEYPSDGKNTATIRFGDETKKITYTAYKIESIIDSVELTNVEDYLTAKVDYNNYLYTEGVHGETLTVYFKDGTKTEAVVGYGYAEITLPCGKTVEACIGEYWTEGDEVCFAIEIAGHNFAEYEYEIERQTIAENLLTLKEDNDYMLYWAKEDFITGIENIVTDPEWAFEYFGWSVREFFQVFTNMITFMRFYLSL